MTAIADPTAALAQGLAAIRTEFDVPAGVPAPVLAAADGLAEGEVVTLRLATADPVVRRVVFSVEA